jgi:hypothetical protein
MLSYPGRAVITVKRIVCGEALVQIIAIEESELGGLAAGDISCPVCGLRHALRIDEPDVGTTAGAKEWVGGQWQRTRPLPKTR